MLEAQTEDGKPAWVNPRKVVVEDLTEGTCHKPSAERIRPEACVRLSQAMTASGAGLSLDSLVEEWYRNDFVRVLMRFGTASFNLNNEVQTWNQHHLGFCSHGHCPAHLPDTKSRWIEITDGSFYDNLGI